ncbi:MAG: fumarylacetoacetate hydrolase family protein [Bryobacteraceae bacterium]|jgi:2-dehydro-3-deoxy-D-arabinonate dehydratase|nr:fumarylacetoacetate hydrolase family protein [Bryobacteraceae bacterium]
MKIGQVWWQGRLTAAVFENGHARPIPGYSLRELVDRGERDGVSLADLAGRYAVRQHESIEPALPIEPREVWACGCTYEMSASFRDAEHGTREGFYRHVFTAPRPEIFFKGTSRVCVGPAQRVGIRADSRFTAPEPELAVLLGAKGRVLGYTLANDVSAWDIERENPLYLPQSKVYTACCALGPWFVTPEELTDPYSLDMRCLIERGGQVLFDGSTSTSKLGRKIEELVEYLLRANPVPAASVLLTGTGIIVTEAAALAEGDSVRIECPRIGTLVNGTMIVR